MRYLRGIAPRWRIHGAVGTTREGTGNLGFVGVALQEANRSFPCGGWTPRGCRAATPQSGRGYPRGEGLILSTAPSPAPRGETPRFRTARRAESARQIVAGASAGAAVPHASGPAHPMS